ncbi:MAG: alpha/beta hydrolase [Arcanobacterium sp.]|nr:alpha/beta hydrolase [Arcanobacterium sp.]
MKLAMRRTGPESNLPLVLLHALPLSQSMWDEVRAELVDLDVITFDAPGFGQSPTVAELGIADTIAAYADLVLSQLTENGIERFVLGGLSMGGATASEIFRRAPHRVAGLALMDTNIASDPIERQSAREIMAQKAESGMGYECVQDWTRTMLAAGTSVEIRQALDQEFKEFTGASFAWAQRAMASRANNELFLRELCGPLLLVRGVEDPGCSSEMLERWAEIYTSVNKAPAPRIVEIPGAGHFTANEQPKLLAQELRGFYYLALSTSV